MQNFPKLLSSQIAFDIARVLLDGFEKHYRLFRQSSQAARRHFEQMTWKQAQAEARERIAFYELRVKECVQTLEAAVFFVLSGIASTTKRDFSFLNKFLLVGFVVIMLAVLAQIFLQSPLMQLVLCGAFIIFSSAAILFQINAIVRGGETNYVSATLSLYVSLYNIFTSLLQILGVLGGDRD